MATLMLGFAIMPAFAFNANHFNTHLTGDQDSVVTLAQGETIFRLSSDGQSLQYKLVVANIENVTQAHIHLGAKGVNGPIVVWLYPSAPPLKLIPGRSDGVLAEGVITAANFVGLLAGHPFSDLIAAIEAGNAYVNVHTVAHPMGEIRGQIP